MSELRARISRGLTWSAVGAALAQVTRLLFGVVLARLLTPEEFGLVGMVAVFTSFIVLFPELGLGAAIVRSEAVDDLQLSTVFWINVAIGTVIGVGFAAAAPLLARFYDEPKLIPLAMALAAGLFLANLGVVHRHLLIRAMEFRALTGVGFATDLVAGVVAVGMAMSGFGAWSLVAHSLLRSGVPVVALWFIEPWRPSFRASIGAVRSMLQFGGNLMAFNVVDYCTSYIDNLLVGKYHGDAALGVYQKAYELMELPTRQMSRVLSRVMLPAMSSIQADHERSRLLMLRAVRGIAFVTFPLQAFVFVTAEPLVVGVLGEQWRGVVPVLKVLCPIGMLNSIGTTVGWIYLGQGRSDWMLRWQLGSSGVRVAGIVLGLPYGPVGVATGYALAMALLAYPSLAIAGSLIGLKVVQVARAVVGTAVVTALAAVAAHVTAGQVAELPLLGAVAAAWGVGGLCFLAMARLLRLRAFEETRLLIREQLGRRAGG